MNSVRFLRFFKQDSKPILQNLRCGIIMKINGKQKCSSRQPSAGSRSAVQFNMAASSCSKMIYKNPIVVILGSTGTGKSKLAIELAKKFKGEIISADSMQVYEGLDIITNKVTKEELAEVPHHLMSFLAPTREFKIVDFRDRTLRVVDDLINRQKLPIIVGGTNYYIESILYQVLMPVASSDSENNSFERPGSSEHANDSAKCLDTDSDASGDMVQGPKRIKLDENPDDPRNELESLSNEELYERLKKVDPEMANRSHPNNRRKIIRSLEVYQKLGRKHSELIEEQKSQPKGCSLGGPLRFQNSVILWLRCDQAVLDARLDARVDEMLAQGLIKELLDFHSRYNQQRLLENKPPDYTKGIFQSIGFKEFHEYLMLDEEKKQSEEGKKLFEKCVGDLKLATRRYARRQIKWVTNRFLRTADREVPPLYGLDATDVSKWKEIVYDTAENIVDSFLKGEKASVEPLPVLPSIEHEYQSRKCEICDRVFVDTIQWNIHLKSNKHKRVVERKKRLEKKTAEEEASGKTENTES